MQRLGEVNYKDKDVERSKDQIYFGLWNFSRN